MFGNFLLVLGLTILVAGTADSLPQGGWISGLFGRSQPAADATNAVTTTITAVPVQHNMGVLVSDLKNNAGIVASQLSEMKGEGMKVLAETKQKVGGIIAGLKSVISGDSIKQITGNILDTREKLVKIGQDVQVLYQSRAGKPISDQLKIISDSIGVLLGKLGSAIAGDGGGKVMADIGQHIGNAVDEINAIISGESVQKIITAVNSISGKLGNAVNGIGTAVVGGRGKRMGEYIGDIGKTAVSAMSQVADIVGDENAKKLVGDFGKQMDSAVSEVSSIVENDSIGKLTSMASKISGEVGQATDEVKSFVKNANVQDALELLKSNGNAVQLLTKYGGGFLGKFIG